ncbi:MAG: aminoglycoside phosphotransferase family protein [Alphaproteobacteria bacterium]
MTDRAGQISDFLEANGWGGARRRPLPGDASRRRYERLAGGPRPALLMDAPPPEEDAGAYARIARHLYGLDFSAPEILAEDARLGLLVIEDFGDRTYTNFLNSGGDERALYETAIDVLVALHRHAGAAGIDLRAYDEEAFLDEAALLADWYLPAMPNARNSRETREEYMTLWRQLLPLAGGLEPTLTLRDYHVDNLMWLSGRQGVRRCGLLDFQDALIGSPVYDLVSLLLDARRDVPEALIAAMTERYLAGFPKIDQGEFTRACAILSVQRNCKILGIFTRLSVRDAKPVYLRHIPRVWRWIARDIEHPALAPMKAWFERHIPGPARGIPPIRPAA